LNHIEIIIIYLKALMKNIIKNKSNLNFLSKSIDSLERTNKLPQNKEILRLYRDVLKMTLRFTWANEDG
jgi:predicted PP-loop superfamily ATPase